MNQSDPGSKPIGRYRQLQGVYKWYFRLVTAISALLSFVYIFKIVIFGRVMPEMSYFSVLIGAFVSSAFLIFPATKDVKTHRIPWYDVVCAGLSLLIPIYILSYNIQITFN